MQEDIMNVDQPKWHRNLELDRLRAFAVLMTIFIHFSRIFFPWDMHQEYQNGGTITNLLENSWMGVDLFFVISGYIISKMIVEKLDACCSDTFQRATFIKQFFIKRFFRIYPLAVSFFIFVFLCSIFFNSTGNFSSPENNLEAGVSIFTYTFNYYFGSGKYHAFTLSPYWSLSLEEQFYLLFPFFLVFVKSHRNRVITLILTLIVLTFIVRPLSEDNIFYTQNRCDGLIYGCLLYYLSMSSSVRSIFTPFKTTPWYAMLSIGVLIFILSTVTSLGYSNAVVIPLGCIVASILVAIASQEINVISFGKPINLCLNYFGSRSYSLYIVHFPMFTLTQEIFYRLSLTYHWNLDKSFTWPYTLLALALTLIVSEFSYRLIEVTWIARGKKYLSRSSEEVTFLKSNQLNLFINQEKNHANYAVE